MTDWLGLHSSNAAKWDGTHIKFELDGGEILDEIFKNEGAFEKVAEQ